MVLMLWFYISGLVILAGAEMNAEIEHASPYGKAAGEKVPGEKAEDRACRDACVARTLAGASPPSPLAVEKTSMNTGIAPSPAPLFLVYSCAAIFSYQGEWVCRD